LFKVLAVAVASGAVVDWLLDGASTARALATLSPDNWLLIVYLGLVCAVGGYSLWFVVVKDSPVNTVALTLFLQPLAGTIIAVVWLGESVRWGQMLGFLVILAGLMIGFSRQIRVDEDRNSLNESRR
jgi:drug/metabolite transporter (DMT)-like permease